MIPRLVFPVSALLFAWSILPSAQQKSVPSSPQAQTASPAPAETLQAPRTYFDRAWHLCFPAGGSSKPYVLRAEFEAKGANGITTGHYKDTWMSETQWRREATFGESRCIRTRNGNQRYELSEGPDVPALRFIMRALEPIPAADKVVDSAWKVKADVIDGVRVIRLLAGSENPDGTLDPKQDLAYWFDQSGLLVRTNLTGFQTDFRGFEAYGKLSVARLISVRQYEALAIRIRITDLKPSPRLSADRFRIPGYKVERILRAEER